jgi:pimeloyl-ACP methyl ester carboxylesterase
MDTFDNKKQSRSWSDWQSYINEYIVDSIQRSIIFLDILRKRGNGYIRHIKSGQPPVLRFNYEMILNGKNFERPVNYALVKITDRRRKDKDDHKDKETHDVYNRRHDSVKRHASLPKRPIIIMDPRAGHGPGIGGSKRDSEIGMAMDHDHPVYFILFYTEPIPGQTIADVEAAEVKFIEKVNELHPNADSPAIMGNCQAGWAAALLCADRPDITGPLVLNGAPLSYWSGVVGQNPMRYKGGLVGGAWVNSLLGDLGNGVFDGSHLVANFEDLNPANTLWAKQYNVYANLDTEEERYLVFEKWWGGFFLMTTEEIHFIVSQLFVGNKLEKGQLELRPGEKISLKNIVSPILVFASRGDNITPVQQALNWIPRVYSSVDDIKRHGQVIIYIIHEDIGHLGIFVSGSVAKKEHSEIVANFDMIDYLTPGLYEMIIEGDVLKGDFAARYEERTLEDIAAMDDGTEDEEDFSVVAKVSEANDNFYQHYIRPWVKLYTTELSAEIIRNRQPLRMKRYMLSDMNPLMRPVESIAAIARKNRKPASADNPMIALEKDFSEYMGNVLNIYRDYRDLQQEQLFRMIYGSEFMRMLFPPDKEEIVPMEIPECERDDYDKRMQPLEEGGLAAGLIRVFMAIAKTGHGLRRRHFELGEEIAQTHKVLSKLRPVQFKKILKQQAAILQADEDRAINALSVLIPNKDDRMDALGIAKRLCLVDGVYNKEEETMIGKIKKALEL